jgi:hypothetical protein
MNPNKEVQTTTLPEEKDSTVEDGTRDLPLSELPKGRWDRSWPVIACGAGLFSDGELCRHAL